VWQNKRTGLFRFLGEHNGRPVYQNNATKEYLYYTFTGAEWLVGPDFRKPHAGKQSAFPRHLPSFFVIFRNFSSFSFIFRNFP
jgi:hypothetical protein